MALSEGCYTALPCTAADKPNDSNKPNGIAGLITIVQQYGGKNQIKFPNLLHMGYPQNLHGQKKNNIYCNY